MASDLTKRQKRRLRELAAQAHELELDQKLADLHERFDRWKAGDLHGHDLNEEIHRFHNGVSRDLYKMYAMGDPFFGVARAIYMGILDRSNIEPDMLELFDSTIEFLRREDEND